MRKECPECRGRGVVRYPALEPMPFRVDFIVDATAQSTVTARDEACRTCKGARDVAVTERIPVMQHGKQVGTVPPEFDPTRIRSTNWLYEARPGDFRQEGLTWVASRTLGPGDLEAVPGFVWD